MKTPKKRPAKPFQGAKDGKPFTKETQPSPQAKSAGWQKKRTLKQLLAMELRGTDKSAQLVRSFVSKYLGIKENEVGNEITLEIAMHLRQIEKAITKGDTRAYEAVNERAYGKKIQADISIENINLDDFTVEELRMIEEDEATPEEILRMRKTKKEST